jgi:uncharacterized repeat protein (TIGR01451 family)
VLQQPLTSVPKLAAYRAGEITNTACVNATEVNPRNPSEDDDCDNAVITITPTPAVTIEKKVNNQERDEVAVGEDFTYSLVVKNTGNVTLTNVVVTDTAPAGVTFLSTDNIANNVLNYTIPSLAPGASITINIRAEASAYRAGEITNTACVNATEVNPRNPSEDDDCDNAVITITPTPAVTIEKKVNNQERDEVAVGEDFTYSLVVKNTGNVTLTNVVVTDTAPAGVTFLSTDNIANNVLNYTIPSLAPGASITINIRAEASAYRAGEITNTACVNATEVNPRNPSEDDDCDNAVITITPTPRPSINVEKRVTMNINAQGPTGFDAAGEIVEAKNGDIVRFIIKLTNTGNTVLTNVAIADYLPSDLAYAGGDSAEVVIPVINPGQNFYIEVDAKVVDGKIGSTTTNYACAFDDIDPNMANINKEKCQKVCENGSTKIARLQDCDTAQVKIVKTPTSVNPGPRILPRTGATMIAVVGSASALGTVIRSWISSKRKIQSALLK